MTQKKLNSVIEEARTATVSDEYGPGNERWKRCPLSELMKPVLGKTPKRSEDEYWGGDIQWASAKDISQSETRHVYDTEENMTEAGREASNAKILPEGTVVVIARGATMGRVAQLGEPMTFNQTCYALDTDDDLLDDYLYYAWQYVFGQVQAVSYGTVFDTITMKSFEDIEIPVPPLKTQEKIASVLATLDNKIEINIEIKRKLPKLAQYIFNSWFVEFEPYTEFKTTEVGEIPSNFKIRNLSEIVDLQRGLSYKGEHLNDEEPVGHPMINLGNIKPGGGYRPEKLKYYTEEPKERYTTEPGELIISHTDMTQDREILGSPVIVPNLEADPIIFSHHLYAVKNPKLPEEFLYPYFLSPYFKEKAESYASGTTVLSFSSDIASDALVPIPNEEDLERYVNLTSPLFELEDSLRSENDQIRNLLETLLPELISGRVKIPT